MAAEPLSLSYWSQQKKEKILLSRVLSTEFLSEIIASLKNPPRCLIVASAVGFYGDRKEELLNEESPQGDGFLAGVCTNWERASSALEKSSTRVVHTRFGVVFSGSGGVLMKILPIYKMGLGSILGSGKQWISWIHLNDLCRGIFHVLQDEKLKGPINFVSTSPIRQKEFSKTLAKALHRPHFLWAPSFFLKLIFGTMGKELLLNSTKVQPTKLIASKFSFRYPDFRSVLDQMLQKELK